MRVHKQHFVNGVLQPGAFRDVGGMSVNWQKYCATAVAARRLAKTPQANAVIALPRTGAVREVQTAPPLRVEHTPDFAKLDRSHAEVFGDKNAAVRVALLKIARLEIRVEDPVE
jgi:hypothetical protein